MPQNLLTTSASVLNNSSGDLRQKAQQDEAIQAARCNLHQACSAALHELVTELQ